MDVVQNVRSFQAVRQHQRFVGQQFHRASIGDDLAMIQNNRPRAQLHRQFQIVRGKASVIRKIADELIAAKGVKHGKLTVTTTGKDLPS